MWYKLKIWLQNPSENLWLTPALGAIFATFFSLFATASRYFIPDSLVPNISIETLGSLLDIISSSMLAVTTFSLSIMVAAFASASTSGTPRAYSLMMNDDNTRVAIASFISAFIYAVIAKIALGLESYGASGRFVLFLSTILVLFYLIYTLIRWIQTLSKLGSLSTTILKIEEATARSLSDYRLQPQYGAIAEKPHYPVLLHLYSHTTGYLCDFNLEGLQALADQKQLHLHICAMPGKFLDPSFCLVEVYSTQQIPEQELAQIQQDIWQHIVIRKSRSFVKDPRFGLLVMTEVAQKALSPAVNDGGSALTAVNALTRILVDSQANPDESAEECPRLSIVHLDEADFIYSTFLPIARDGANNYELHLRLIKSLSIIYHNVDEPALVEAAYKCAITIVQRAEQQLSFKDEYENLKQLQYDLFLENLFIENSYL